VSRRDVLRAGAGFGALAVLGPLLAACSDPSEERVRFLNWQDYIDPEVLRRFADETGLSVAYDTYASNDELADRLALSGVARRRGRAPVTADLVVPSDNLFRRLLDEDRVQAFDRDVVTDALLANLAPEFRELEVDPGNRYSIPWATGTTGIGYDRTVFAEPPDWEVFLDEEHRRRMTLLDERREAFAAALFSLGEDPNSTDPAVVSAAADRLAEMQAIIRGFDSAGYLDALAAGELVAAQAFSTDLLQARRRNPDLEFVIPEAGGTRWIDLLAVPDDAPNPQGANRLVAFVLDPEISALNAVQNQVDTGNAAARDEVPASLLADPVVYPPPDVEARLTFLDDLGDDEALYTEAWDELRA